jgi:IclR family transcriptional regulator, KDG regulon repressor
MRNEGSVSDGNVVQSLDRALSLLDLISFSDHELTLGEIAGRSGLAKSTAHRLLRTLELRGFVARNPVSGSYRPGLKNFRGFQGGPLVHRALADLAERSGETANLGALAGAMVLYVDRADSPQALRWQLGVGERVPAHCSGLGKAILAHIRADAVERLLPPRLEALTGNTITDRRGFLEQHAAVRRRGYALDDEEFMEGVRCVAMPIIGPGGEAVAAVSISGPAFRFTDEVIRMGVVSLRQATTAIGRQLGFEPPDGPARAGAAASRGSLGAVTEGRTG